MKPESIAMGVAGICFGLIAGWILGAQQGGAAGRPIPGAQTRQTSGADRAPASGSQPPALDQSQVQALRSRIDGDPKDGIARAQLANLYFDAERYDEAITWYEEALQLSPRDVDISTDLGVAFYYTNQPDRALKQFDRSLSLDPKHTKTILNVGIVRAFGKQDLEGAAKAWQEVIQLAPDSVEAQAARRALDSLKAAHPGVGGTPDGSPGRE